MSMGVNMLHLADARMRLKAVSDVVVVDYGGDDVSLMARHSLSRARRRRPHARRRPTR